MGRVLRSYIPIHKVLEYPVDILLRENCASVIKSYARHSELHQPQIKQKPTTIDLIIYKHSITLNYATSLALGLSGSSQTPGVTHFPFSFHLINLRNKKIKPYIHPAFLIRSATPGAKRRIHLSDGQLDKTNTCD